MGTWGITIYQNDDFYDYLYQIDKIKGIEEGTSMEISEFIINEKTNKKDIKKFNKLLTKYKKDNIKIKKDKQVKINQNIDLYNNLDLY